MKSVIKKSAPAVQVSLRSSSAQGSPHEPPAHSHFRWFFPTLRLMLALVFVAALAKAEWMNTADQQQSAAAIAVSGEGVGWFNLGY
ncbi:hypothetical protein [Marinobacterium mangrovicola]|uniref:Uncharacterized protein n=1 Tax=Marinobacterium mangrovicola TaxID=1476959 RepID=A0A4R1GNP6_9GAMM|nr:hypothetical protein [Marinobacterium mangrovicola]TCK09001.1 hypothetical protein CLV83_1099 [Marinobacterium mangrovicola]